MDRRTTARSYDALLPAFFPVKLVGDFIAVDFVVGCHLDATAALDTRVSPRRMLAWLRSMPANRAGVQIRIGVGSDAALVFEKCAELVDLIDPGRSLVYLTRLPLAARHRAFFGEPRSNLLLELTATPRSAALGVEQDPLELVRSTEGLDPASLHWVLGPLACDGEADARRILAGLPPGSRLTLKLLGAGGRPALVGVAPAGAELLARLEATAHGLGHTVTEWSCRGSVARVGQGFVHVDRLTGQADLARRAHDLITCFACPSRTQCHAPLDEATLQARLGRELRVLGLTATAPPVRTGPRAYRLEVAEPTARGDETYLSQVLGPVAIRLSTCPAEPDPGGGATVDPAVLRRWYATGFLPVTELNAVAEKVLEDLTRRARISGGRAPGGRGAGDRPA